MSVDRLRIAMLIWSYWPGHEGGAERQCRKLVPRLAAQGLDIAVWTARTHRDHARRERAGDHEILRLGAGVPLGYGAGWKGELMRERAFMACTSRRRAAISSFMDAMHLRMA